MTSARAAHPIGDGGSRGSPGPAAGLIIDASSDRRCSELALCSASSNLRERRTHEFEPAAHGPTVLPQSKTTNAIVFQHGQLDGWSAARLVDPGTTLLSLLPVFTMLDAVAPLAWHWTAPHAYAGPTDQAHLADRLRSFMSASSSRYFCSTSFSVSTRVLRRTMRLFTRRTCALDRHVTTGTVASQPCSQR